MSQDNPIRIYATHLWEEDDDFLRLFEYLSDVDNFFYVNLSEPNSRPSAPDREAEQAEFRRQMGPAEVVMVLSTQYVTNTGLIIYQMDLAKAMKKPIIAVEPFGPDNILKPVKDKADAVVPWYNRSMVDEIRHLGRGDLTSRYEVIDFP